MKQRVIVAMLVAFAFNRCIGMEKKIINVYELNLFLKKIEYNLIVTHATIVCGLSDSDTYKSALAKHVLKKLKKNIF